MIVIIRNIQILEIAVYYYIIYTNQIKKYFIITLQI